MPAALMAKVLFCPVTRPMQMGLSLTAHRSFADLNTLPQSREQGRAILPGGNC